jgi:hypothetical protein
MADKGTPDTSYISHNVIGETWATHAQNTKDHRKLQNNNNKKHFY